MTGTKPPFVFISYRREDAAAAALWLWTAVKRTFGPASVFMDSEGIQSGDEWENTIGAALDKATVVIALIGSHWLEVRDEFKRRRIDRPDDWVRRELTHALQSGATVIPLLLADMQPLPPEAMDAPLASLSKRQAFRLRNESWESDLERLLQRLDTLGFTRIPQRNMRYPTPRVKLRELRGPELAEALRHLPGWEEKESEVVGEEYRTARSLYKTYEFASFEDAIRFMSEASAHATRLDHHPRWENIWIAVTVWLSTWDIGHKISPLDVELANALDEVRSRFAPAHRKAAKPAPSQSTA